MMVDNTRKITIGSNEYTIFLLPALQGIRVGKELGTVFAPVMGSMMETKKDEVPLDFGELASIVVESLDDFDMEKNIKALLNGLQVNGQQVNFDLHFMANYGELFQVLKFAIEENFGSFFENLAL